MKLTDADKLIELLQQVKAGKQLQYRSGDSWFDSEPGSLSFHYPLEHYRIKPEPKLRPWTADEVPVGARYRGIAKAGYCATILGFTPRGIVTSANLDESEYSFQRMLQECEYSLDNGKTWLPCGVEE